MAKKSRRDQGSLIGREFESFLESDSSFPVPSPVSRSVLESVRASLHPGAWSVFAKLSLIHFFTAAATLSVCPQFGVRILGEGLGLMRHFMIFGAYGCMVACGSFFLGTSLLVAALVLRAEELRVLRSHRLLQLAALASLSLGALIMLDAEILLGFAAAWLAGTVMAGAAVVEIGWRLRGPRLSTS